MEGLSLVCLFVIVFLLYQIQKKMGDKGYEYKTWVCPTGYLHTKHRDGFGDEPSDDIQNDLRQLGLEGWELVGLSPIKAWGNSNGEERERLRKQMIDEGELKEGEWSFDLASMKDFDYGTLTIFVFKRWKN